MKYRLKPDNRGAEDEVILDDLRRVAALAPHGRLTGEFYGTHGRFDRTCVARRFHGWNAALARAGLELSKKTSPRSSDEAVEDVRRVARLLGAKTVTTREYDTHGRFSSQAVAGCCHGWLAALSMAGLAPSRNLHVTDEQWFRNIAAVWDHLGRQPNYDDMARPPSLYSPGGYAHRFHGWRKALEAFVAFMGEEHEDGSASDSPPLAKAPKPEPDARRGPRKPGWRLEFCVKRRDRYRCRACGRSVDEVKLQVDHIIPWSRGGRTELDNLQTLCERCNGGKSNLDWEEPS